MTQAIAVFALDGACLYGDETQVTYISNLVHNSQRITFTMLPNGCFIVIGKQLIVVASDGEGIDKLLSVAELGYQFDPLLSNMTRVQIEEFQQLDYFAYLDQQQELKTVQVKAQYQRKYPEMRGSKQAIASLLTGILSQARILVKTNSSELFQHALFANDLGLHNILCLSFQPLDQRSMAQVVFCFASNDEVIRPQVAKSADIVLSAETAIDDKAEYDFYCEAFCDELNCVISDNADTTLTQVLEPIRMDFDSYLNFIAVTSELQVAFPGFPIKNQLYLAFQERMRSKWQRYLSQELDGYSVSIPGTKKTLADILQLKKCVKYGQKRKMREIGIIELATIRPPYVESFMAFRLDLWLQFFQQNPNETQ